MAASTFLLELTLNIFHGREITDGLICPSSVKHTELDLDMGEKSLIAARLYMSLF